MRQMLSSTKINLPIDINDPYDLGLLLRHLRHHSALLANIGDPEVKDAVLAAMEEDHGKHDEEGQLPGSGKCISKNFRPCILRRASAVAHHHTP